MELIDKAALPEHKFPEVQCNGFGDGPAYRQGWNDAIDAIVENEPPVDAVPVVHGRWEEDVYNEDSFWRCTACGFVSEAHAANLLYKFCPNCGARMDGKDGGNGNTD